MLAAVGRQRPQPDSDAAKQQMLVTTLRLAGHTVNLLPNERAGPGDADQPVDNNPADGTDGPEETSADPRPDAGNPLVHDGVDRINDPTLSADDGKRQLLPFIINDPARPADYGKPQLLPDILTGPTLPAGSGLPRPQPIGVPLPNRISPGAAMNGGTQVLPPDVGLDTSSSGFEATPADSDGFSPPLDDPSAADIPPVSDPPPALSITLDGDSPDPDPSPAPGIKLFIPSPGAGSLLFRRRSVEMAVTTAVIPNPWTAKAARTTDKRLVPHRQSSSNRRSSSPSNF